MIGDGQPRYQSMDRIKAAGLACGYRFRVLSFEASATQSRVTIRNMGVAPIYHDAFVAVNDVRASDSLKGLLPGEERTFSIRVGGNSPRLTIACDRLVPGQSIEFEADLEQVSDARRTIPQGTAATPSAFLFSTMNPR